MKLEALVRVLAAASLSLISVVSTARAQPAVDVADLPPLPPADEDLSAGLYETTQEVLEAAGFEAYEVSNHARGEAARSTHNLAYWRGHDYVGVGPGAHGRLTIGGGRIATFAEPAAPARVFAPRDIRGSPGSGGPKLSPNL